MQKTTSHHYHAIYLSPHLDDVALSCGGTIARQIEGGDSVLIVTVMAGEPPIVQMSDYIRSLHDRWELEVNAVAARQEEDRVAAAILGADIRHWSIPDCIYRLSAIDGEPFYGSDADIFGDIHAEERSLIDVIAAKIEALPRYDRLYAPLTLGHHVDHQLTRLAAEQAAGAALCYYEDYPYAQQPGALDEVIPADDPGWQAAVVPLTEAHLQTKVNAIYAFRSQLSTFFEDREDLQRQVFDYARQVGGERFWGWSRSANSPKSITEAPAAM